VHTKLSGFINVLLMTVKRPLPNALKS